MYWSKFSVVLLSFLTRSFLAANCIFGPTIANATQKNEYETKITYLAFVILTRDPCGSA
jgi:hypothetical protein